MIDATYHWLMHHARRSIAGRPTRTTWGWLMVLSLALAALLALPMAARAQSGTGGPGIAQGPSLANVPPPAWVRPGTRVTFYSAAASVTQRRYQLIEDPSGPWQDPVTGKRYRSTEDAGESVDGASGDGVSQVDVVALDGNDVILGSTLYGIDRNSGTLSVLPGAGVRTAGGAIDGLWMSPLLLSQLRTGSVGGLLVLRGDYPLNGTTYQALSIVNPTPGAYSSQTYDTRTGVLLASTTNTAGTLSPVRLPGQGPVQGPTQLTISRFVSIRQMTTPGIGSPVPAWVPGTPGLTYSGRYRWTNPIDPSSGSISYPMTAQTTFTSSGTTWALYGLRSQIDLPGSSAPTDSTGVSSGIGPYWWDPGALTGFRDGQVLDTDPVTTMTVTVTGQGSTSVGPDVTITSQVPGTNGSSTYDVASGVLLGQVISVASSGIEVDLALDQLP